MGAVASAKQQQQQRTRRRRRRPGEAVLLIAHIYSHTHARPSLPSEASRQRRAQTADPAEWAAEVLRTQAPAAETPFAGEPLVAKALVLASAAGCWLRAGCCLQGPSNDLGGGGGGQARWPLA